MGASLFLFLSVFNDEIGREYYRKDCHPTNKDIKTFHLLPSYRLSLGVIKYAVRINTTQSKIMLKPNKRESFSATSEPIMPAVKTYLAASAKILATTFLLSLFIAIEVYHTEEAK